MSSSFKIVTIVGARPQFIKASALSRLIRERDDVEELIIHTGQHFDDNMSAQFFKELDLPKPQANLGINQRNREAMLEAMTEKLIPLLKNESPDMVMVYGDTNSTLAGARAAKKVGLRLAHIEAGLRSFDLSMPEENNRIETDQLADLLFCPTEHALDQLKKEGLRESQQAFFSGDVMYDVFLFHEAQIRERAEKLGDLGAFGLVTVHREANLQKEKLFRIVEALNRLSESMKLVWPCHPRTKEALKKNGFTTQCDLTPPLSYTETLARVAMSSLVVTDSGGLQREAYFLDKPCVVLRDHTEWSELITEGGHSLWSQNAPIVLPPETTKKEGLLGHGQSASYILDKFFGTNSC